MSLFGILLAVVVATALGMLWFSPLMFGKTWAKLSKLDMGGPDDCKGKGMWKSLCGNILLNFVTAIMVYTILAAGFHMTDLFAIWSAFALPIFANEVFWGGAPLKLFLINAGFSVVSLAFMSQVILWVM